MCVHITVLVIIPGLLSIHLNKQKDLLFAGESMYLDEAYECDPCLESAMISLGMSPHVLISVETHPYDYSISPSKGILASLISPLL
jgi:hypothetical protein